MLDSTLLSGASLALLNDGQRGFERGFAAIAHPLESAITPPKWVPCDDLELTLMTIWEAALGAAPADVDADFFDEGGDSLLAIDLCDHVRRAFGTELNFNTFISEPTFARIARILRDGAGRTSNRAMIPLRTRGSKPPLFLLPGAGGSIFGYRRFVEHLAPGRPVYGLRLPDAGPAPDAALRIEDLAAEFVAKIQDLQPSGPYYVGGYSFGGRVAIEIAQQLVARGEEIGRLALFDTYGPGYPRILPPGRRLLEHAVTFALLDSRKRREYLAARLRRFAQRCDRVISRLTPGVSYLVPASIRAEFDWHRDASARYRPRIYPGRLTLFRAREQPRALGADYSDPCLGWGPLAAGGVEIHEVPGAHVALFDDENVAALAAALSSCLG